MPRRKAADRVGPVKTRSRGGCKECRASRVRCDTQKPVCTRCRERGLPCSTELVLKWESEFVSRGLAFGRAGVWNKSRAAGGPQSKLSSQYSDSHLLDDQEWCSVPFVEPWGFVNSGVSTFEQPDQVNIACDELNGLVVRTREPVIMPRDLLADPGSPLVLDVVDYHSAFQHVQQLQGPSSPLPLFPNISQTDHRGLFDYYLQHVCPRTTASSKASSPFASVILPFCLSASPTMFHAIQALGACHWSRFNPDYSTVALRFKSQALKGLRYRLSPEGSLGYSQDPEVLVIMMMLCLYEIVDNCDQRWTVHLKGAKDLIRFRRQQQLEPPKAADTRDPVSTFAERFFAFQDVMGRTACGEEVLFGSDYWQEDEGKVDLWMGCSPELVSILSSITELSRTRRQLSSDSARASFSLCAASLERKLENLVQEIDDDDDDSLLSAAELKRLAAVLYLHCALYGASPATPLVVSYVRRILRIVSDLLDSGSLVSMTWPVFVAAVELDPVHDEVWAEPGENAAATHGRPLVLRALAAMAESSVSNVARTRAVIVKVWQARDNDMLKGSPVEASNDPTSCNDWEWYVAPISTAMSLA
ncbi:C6 zinc finger domain protein [Aspergillus ambiguus]|uniref:Zn(II)2Cys6 transcription factor n=1 Tax=Aspergillus ambiguus TaxID=176160 RepID=UPI003CCDB9BA